MVGTCEVGRFQDFIPSRDLKPVRSSEELVKATRAIWDAYGLDQQTEKWIYLDDAWDELSSDSEDGECQDDDVYETQCVIHWLRTAISWACKNDCENVDVCADLLVRLAGQSAAGQRSSTYRFFPGHKDETHRKLHESAGVVTIRDISLTEDALGGRTWGAASYLACRLVRQWQSFAPRAVLELGAGTGLTSLALNACLHNHTSHFLLTDFHPQVLANLRFNVQHNLAENHCNVIYLDWKQVYDEMQNTELKDQRSSQEPFHDSYEAAGNSATAQIQGRGNFDMIIAADCIYHPLHTQWISAVAQRYLAQKQNTEAFDTTGPTLQLLLPIREKYTKELQSVYQTFSSSPWQILSDTQLVGVDDFGPITMARTHKLRGRPVTFRHIIVGWAS
ncbi:hypothetical protein MYAM1_003371 [Malassezia yamatoensis]|uniref:Uncharacterized protein n=1 Tax=Malassezia yamatoensis TaxID=253288 RepID=A0AAJ6CI61_9BASI|nr:hypothetical protein MYAM1_003371 [Malassezia yamatoensis]